MENINNVQPVITVPEPRDGLVCTRIDVIVEKRFRVIDEMKRNAGASDYLVRAKIATWSFPSFGSVSEITVRKLDFTNTAKMICISRFESVSGRKRPETLVTVSKELVGYCQPYRVLVPSYEYAMSFCDRLRAKSWSSHVTRENIEAFVSLCEESIRFE